MSDPLRDPETGMLNAAYFLVALEHRLAVARRGLRPLSVALVEVHGADRSVALEVAGVLRQCLRTSDTACRLGLDRFGLLLEETPEDGAVWTVERLRRTLGEEGGPTMWAGVASYPAHALDADALRRRASQALVAARDWRQGRIEVALPE